MEKKIIYLLKKNRKGLNFQRILRELQLRPKDKFILKKKLRDLEKKGVIWHFKRKYYLPTGSNIIKGKYVPTQKGYGFVIPEQKLSEDIFIPARYSGDAFHGDTVEVLYKEAGKKGKPEGRIVRITKKGRKKLLGVFKKRMGQAFFLPLDSPALQEIPVSYKKSLHPEEGMIVEVDRETKFLTRVLGEPDKAGVDTEVIINRYNLRSSFKIRVLEEAKGITESIKEKDRQGRKDFRNRQTITIDGKDAKDFDDAVSVKKMKNGLFLLGVHIADVSHYVKPGSSLDKEAFERGTSVYFPDRTLPMLPEKLSNFVCSLRPKEEKLTVSVFLEIDDLGNVIKSDFFPSLIKTKERMTYDSVNKILNGDKKETEKYSNIVNNLLIMRDLSRILRGKRYTEGSLDFDFPEPKLLYKKGDLYSIISDIRNEAHQIIEEFMIVANEAVASFLSTKNINFIYRVHPPPDQKNLERLRKILSNFNISLPKPGLIGSKNLQNVLEQAEEKPGRKYINVQVLRSLKLAVYSKKNQGHYGLAKEEYTHFTSPIRRYPDLIVHRILKNTLENKKEKTDHLSFIADNNSSKERNAEQAEKDLLEWRIYKFLKRKLGDELTGTIVDQNKSGFFVELDDYFVEGLIPYNSLFQSHYFRNSSKKSPRSKTRKRCELGDRVKVILSSVDPVLRRIFLTLSSNIE
ncbi:MAG: ribonuclease R [Candidatus Aminicenantaceae bacterium]